MRTIDKIVGAVLVAGTIAGCGGGYVDTGASLVIPTKYDAKSYPAVSASSGGQIGPVRIGAGAGHSQQSNDGLDVKTLRYFAELMYVAQNGFYAGIRHNTYNDEISGVFQATETINETDAVVGYKRRKAFVEASASETTIRAGIGLSLNF